MELEIKELKDDIVFPLYSIDFTFNDTHKDLIEYMNTSLFLDMIDSATGDLLNITIEVDLFNIDFIYEYFNNDTATDIKNKVIKLYNKVYG